MSKTKTYDDSLKNFKVDKKIFICYNFVKLRKL